MNMMTEKNWAISIERSCGGRLAESMGISGKGWSQNADFNEWYEQGLQKVMIYNCTGEIYSTYTNMEKLN